MKISIFSSREIDGIIMPSGIAPEQISPSNTLPLVISAFNQLEKVCLDKYYFLFMSKVEIIAYKNKAGFIRLYLPNKDNTSYTEYRYNRKGEIVETTVPSKAALMSRAKQDLIYILEQGGLKVKKQ